MQFIKGKIFLNLIFSLCIFFGIIGLFYSYAINMINIDIPNLGYINPDIRINVETPKENADKIQLYVNGHILKPYIWNNPNTYIAYEINRISVRSILLSADDKTIKNSIDNIVVFIGDSFFYYTKNDILNFKKTIDGKYIFPKDMKFYKKSIYVNDKGGFKHFIFAFLSVFYNWKFYIIPILFFLGAFFIYQNNKDKINFGFNLFKQNAIWLIIGFAFLIRICDNSFNLWSDELYTITHSSWPSDSWIWTFKDPGNPPFFFILAKVWMILFGTSEVKCRLLTTIFSCVSIYLVYKFLKDNLSSQKAEKIGLFAAFILALSISSIQEAQDFRAYSLGGMFCILSIYLLFEIIKNKKTRDYIIYGILAVCMANTHYFQIFILFGNFIYAMFFLENKEKLKFFAANFAGALSFLPFFLMTALNNALLNEKFNDGIKRPELADFIYNFAGFFASYLTTFIIILILCLFFIPKTNKKFFNCDDSLKKILIYCAYLMTFVFVSSHLISQIRPIVKDFYFTNIIPVMPIIIAILCFLPYKKKILGFICSLIILVSFFSGKLYYKKMYLSMITFKEIGQYLKYDSEKYRMQGKKIAFFMHDVWDSELKKNNSSNNYFKFYSDILKGDEIVLPYIYSGKGNIEHMYKELKESRADVAYARLENKRFVKTCIVFEKDYIISVIRCNKDIIVARFVKK